MVITYIGIFFWSMIKFLFAPLTALIAIPGINWIENYVLCTSGALVGATFFYYSSAFFMNRTQARRAKKGIIKKSFSKRNKLVIKTKNGIGKWGLALLTASFISIPIGSVILAKFYRHDKKTIFILYLSIMAFGAMTTSVTYLFRA